MNAVKSIVLGLLILGLVCGCTPATPTATLIASPGPTLSAVTAAPTLAPVMVLRIRLATTSDWADFWLVSGATQLSHDLVSASEEAATAEMHGDQFVLDQPIDRAQAQERVEMTVETLFSDWEPGGTLVFEIQRGDLGAAQVEFYRMVDDAWVAVRIITWDGITGDGLNRYTAEIPTDELFGEVPALAVAPQEEREAVSVAPVIGMPQGTDGYPWWNDTVFYEIFVRSFFDSNGDGIGDFNGITQNLDYLNDGDPSTSTDLGVTGIWLMPIYPSHTYHGYNVTDYYGVNPDYGTMEDFRNLLSAAHERGIRVIIDISLGQTSYQHPWFIQASDPSSPYHDWYVWSDHDPGYAGSWGQPVWFPLNGLYYYATFGSWSPDLNLRNPDVTAELREVVRFWLQDVGIDGFRLDSAKHLIEEGTIQANSASTHAWWESFRPFYRQINPQAVTVAEIWDTTAITAEYVQGDELDLAFDFYLAAIFIQSVNEGDSVVARDQLELSYASVPPLQLTPFLTNHDQNRLMNQLGNDPNRVRVAASLLLTAPGVPFLYYGEEIGMQGEKPDELIRCPMQWSAERFAGFTAGSPWEPLGPDWQTFNVASEIDDPASILSHYRALIQARNQHAALRVGDLSVVSTGNNALYSILRVSQDEAVLVLVNLTGEPVTDFRLALEESTLARGDYAPAPILGEGAFASLSVDSRGGFSEYAPVAQVLPYATYVLQLQPNAP